jgi:hypothetical protein
MQHILSTVFGSQRHAITMRHLRLRNHASFARANRAGHESHKKMDGDDGEGRETRARPRRNRSTRREIQGNPAEVRTRARGILRNDHGQRAERHQPALVLALRRSRQVIADGIWRAETATRITPRESRKSGGNETGASTFPLKCSNLARGESTKDPVYISGCGRGFRLSRGIAAARP